MVYGRADEPKACGKISLANAASLLSHYLYSFFTYQCLYIVKKNIYIYRQISDCVETVFELPLLPNNTANEKYLLKSGDVPSVDWIFTIGVLTWG